MMYNEKLVASVKAGGKILREQKDTVFLPFGSEYSILLKNLNSVKAKVSVEIDGEDALDGRSLILDANESLDLERFIKNGNLNEGPKFKFIEKTEQISNYRGDKVEDGIIRVSYRFEIPRYTHVSEYPSYYKTWGGYYSPYDMLGSMNVGYSTDMCRENDSGITVGGSESEQKFKEGDIGLLESNEYVIILNIKGETEDNKPVQKPLTVSRKLRCNVCGTKNVSMNKFCGNCGNNLNY